MTKRNKTNAGFTIGSRVEICASADSRAEDFEGGTGTVVDVDACGASVRMDHSADTAVDWFYFSNLRAV